MKEYELEFLLNGKKVGTSSIIADGKDLLTSAAEDEFYAILRKNEKSLLQEAEEEERDEIISNLTREQEILLNEAHAKDYIGLDDNMPDAFEAWLEDLSLENLKEILK